MISGVGDLTIKTKLITSLKELGATVSETSSYDPISTHLLCPKPARNEKTLSCMAAGKWILHTDYVEACVKASKFLNVSIRKKRTLFKLFLYFHFFTPFEWALWIFALGVNASHQMVFV